MDKKVLVAYASQMGSTAEIAVAIGDQLTRRGFQVDVQPTATAPDASAYDAVLVGSAIYLGHWDKDAVAYLRHQAPDLAERATWLFQSGPCDADADPLDTHTPHAVAKLCREIGIDDPITFAGNLDHSKAKTRLARWVTSGDSAGDFRDWNKIASWAESVADKLESARNQISI